MSILNETADGIESAIEVWRDRLLALDADFVHLKTDPQRWAISEVVGHLVDSACNNHQRFVRAQHVSELSFPKYDQNQWVDASAYHNCDWQSLVQLWYHYNRQIAVLIRNIPEQQLSTPCTITPYETRTLEFLVIDYLDHLNHHFAKLAERIDADQ